MDAIAISHLSKVYRHRNKASYALENVSFSVHEGEMFGLLGPNGAGKTTLINTLSGLLTRDTGEIVILGRDPDKNDKDREFVRNQMSVGMAYTFLSGILSVEQNLRVYGMLYQVKELEQRITELLRLFEIEDLRKKKVFTLSTGQIIRVILCKCLLNNPKILLLDECTVGLDPDIAQKTREILKLYQTKHKTTVIFTSHNMVEVEQLCDRIAFLEKGRILMIGTPKELRKRIKTNSVKVDVVERTKAKKSLREIIKKFHVHIESATTTTIIFLIDNESQLPRIIQEIIRNGFDIVDINVRKPSLEDVFLKVARGEFQQ